MRKFKQLWAILVATAIATAVILVDLVNVTSAQGIVSITPAYQSLLQIPLVSGSSFDSNNPSSIAQMALGPDGRLYAATSSQGTLSFAYDPTTHMLSDQKTAANINALGIGFQGNTMYLSQLVSPTSNLVRLTDDNGNGVWGESGETNPDDALDNDLSDDVYDQFFLIKNQADYGFANGNWRNNSIATAAGFFNPASKVKSTTFDNLDPNAPGFHTLYDPNNPSGLGPSASADGFDFYKGSTLDPQFFNKAFVSRYSAQIQTPDGQETINYADVVLIDPATSKVSVVANGFTNPLDVLADATGLFVADYSGGIYYISAAVPVS